MKPLHIGSSGTREDLIKANELAAILIPRGFDCKIVEESIDLVIRDKAGESGWVCLGEFASGSFNRNFKVFASPDLRRSQCVELSSILKSIPNLRDSDN